MEIKSKSGHGSGALKVSETALAKIARLAASEVEGVALEADNKSLLQPDQSLKGKLFGSVPVRVRLSKEAAEIDISIVTLPGFKAVSIGENIQQAVKTAVQNMAGIAVSKVNVRILGIKAVEDAG